MLKDTLGHLHSISGCLESQLLCFWSSLQPRRNLEGDDGSRAWVPGTQVKNRFSTGLLDLAWLSPG